MRLLLQLIFNFNVFFVKNSLKYPVEKAFAHAKSYEISGNRTNARMTKTLKTKSQVKP